jgi:hypothetical protein
MRVNEKVTLNLNLPSPSETVPAWSLSDTTLASLNVSGGYTATLTALKAGDVVVSVISNCDLGSGVTQHVKTFHINIDDVPAPFVPVEKSPYWKDKDS